MKAKIFLIIVFLIPAASGTVIVNSQDWQDIGKGINHAQLSGEDFFIVNTPGEVEVADKTLDSNVTILQGKNPAVSQIENSINLNVEATKDIENITPPENIEGVLILKQDFGTDMVSAIPYAAKRNLLIKFWSENTQNDINNISKKKIFYGKYDFNPDSQFENVEHIKGNLRERTFTLAKRLNSSTAVLSPRDSFNPESLTQENPVIFASGYNETSQFLTSSPIENLKVIGGTGMFYAKRLETSISKDFAIVAKIGRAFRGIRGKEGVHQIKEEEIPHRSFNLELGEMRVDENSTKIQLSLKNRGSTSPRPNITFETPQNTYNSQLKVPSYTTISLTKNIAGNWSNINVTAETRQRVLQKSYTRENLNVTSIEGLKDVKISDWQYNKTREELDLSFANNGEERTWLLIQVNNRSKRIDIQEGVTANFTLSYINEAPEDIQVFQGQYRGQLVNSQTIELQREQSTSISLIIGLFSLLAITSLLVYLIWKGESPSDLFRHISKRLHL